MGHGWPQPPSHPVGSAEQGCRLRMSLHLSLCVYFHQDSLTLRGSRPFKFEAHYLSRGCYDPSTRPLAHDTRSSGVSRRVKQVLPLFRSTLSSNPRVQEDRSVREETMELCFLLLSTFQPTPLPCAMSILRGVSLANSWVPSQLS